MAVRLTVGHGVNSVLILISLRSLVLSAKDSDGLFSMSDAVARIDSTNSQIRGTVTGTDQAWFVNFYSSFCGHCVRFAPVYKAFGRDVEDWYKVMRIGAIDCSTLNNSATCGQYDATKYPTLKFFSPKSARSHKGIAFSWIENVDDLRRKALNYIEDWLKDNQAPPSWPNLTPHNSVSQLITSCGKPRYSFLVAHNHTYLGREVILDLSYAHPDVCVSQMKGSAASQAGISSVPSLYSVKGTGQIQKINLSGAYRKGIVTAIRSALPGGNAPNVPGSQTTVKTPVSGGTTYTPPDGVYNYDLESVIFYSLWVEIGTHQNITGEKLVVLKHYIDVLSRYYPGPQHVHNFLDKTNTWLKGVSTSLVGQQWLNKINKMQEPGQAFVLNEQRWAACKGSQPRFRGYPCSLWTLFHAITVNAEQIERHDSKFNPKEVPLLINDYIQQFFGCRECAVNFGKGAGTISCDVTRRSDAILWLWRSHNRANHWLHKDPTEDPQQAKIQFPSYRVCALCRRARSYDLFDTKIVWDETNVLQYLKRFYAKARIKQSAKDDAANDSSTGCGYDISVKIVLVVSILFAMCGSWSGHNL